jgi:mannose-1-phosphate guanylyltransferase
MKALLLAAGVGSRLLPITKTIPKCLVSIHGRPLLAVWLDRLVKFRLGPFLINTHYLPDQVESFIEQSQFRKLVTLVYEPKLLGTAGTLIANLDFFEGQDGMLIHADNYCMADLSEFVLAHQNRPSNCLMTMMTFRTLDPSSCGIIDLDERGIVRQLYEKIDNPPGNLANGAVYILSRQLIEMLRCNSDNIHDFSLQILPNLIGHIFTFETQETFIDIGTPEAYSRANRIDFV